MANNANNLRAARCGTCAYYDPRATVCRRRPPLVIPAPGPAHPVTGAPQVAALSLWPPVDELREWCGEYVADPLVQSHGGES